MTTATPKVRPRSRAELRLGLAAVAFLFLAGGLFPRPAAAGEIILGRKARVGRPGPHGGDYHQLNGRQRLECAASPDRRRLLLFLADNNDRPLSLAGAHGDFWRPAGQGQPRRPPLKLREATGGPGGDPWSAVARLEAAADQPVDSGRLIVHVTIGGQRYDIPYNPARLPVARFDRAPAATPSPEPSPSPAPSPAPPPSPAATPDDPAATPDPAAGPTPSPRPVTPQPHDEVRNVGREQSATDRPPAHGGEVHDLGRFFLEIVVLPERDLVRLYLADGQGPAPAAATTFAQLFQRRGEERRQARFASRGEFLEAEWELAAGGAPQRIVLHLTAGRVRYDLSFYWPRGE